MSLKTETLLKSKRGLPRYSANPFIAAAANNSKTGTKRLSNKKGDRFMLVSQETGDVLAPAGFHEIVEIDKTQFVKLYINGVKAFQGLSSPGAKVFELIYRSVQESPGSDRIYLHFLSIEQNITPISRATFNRGMRELIDKGFLAESVEPGMYFLNIDYLFNGNRLAFIKEYHIKDNRPYLDKNQDKPERDAKTIDWVDQLNKEES